MQEEKSKNRKHFFDVLLVYCVCIPSYVVQCILNDSRLQQYVIIIMSGVSKYSMNFPIEANRVQGIGGALYIVHLMLFTGPCSPVKNKT